jgi:CBS domain-containing protein
VTRIPPIKAVMTPFPYSVSLDDPAEKAGEMMTAHEIRHLPVVDDGRLVGVVTRRELEVAGQPALAGGLERPLAVRDLCREGACLVVDFDEPLDNVLLRMAERHLDSALVVRQDKLVGIFTVTDACRGFAEALRADRPAAGDDAA